MDPQAEPHTHHGKEKDFLMVIMASRIASGRVNTTTELPKMAAIRKSNWTERSTIKGVIVRVIQNRTSAKREADLKLRARLLPELYDTRSNYYLIVSITNNN